MGILTWARENTVVLVTVISAVVALFSFVRTESERGLNFSGIEPYKIYRRVVWPIMVVIMLVGEWTYPELSSVIALIWFAVFETIALFWRNEATLSAFLRHLVRRKSNWPMIGGAAIYIVIVFASAVMDVDNNQALKHVRFSVLVAGLSAWIIWHIHDDPRNDNQPEN